MREANNAFLSGILEVDETPLGGTAGSAGNRARRKDAVLIGAILHRDRIRLRVITNTDQKTIQWFVADNFTADTEAIYTDELPASSEIDPVDGGCENGAAWRRSDADETRPGCVCGLLRRFIANSSYQVSPKRLDAYLDDLVHRFGKRETGSLVRDTLMKLLRSDSITHEFAKTA